MEPADAVLIVVNIMAGSPGIGELEVVAALESERFSHFHGEKLCAFVPSAFAWALLRRMGLQSFPNHYVVLDASGREVQIPLAQEYYFAAALLLAKRTGNWLELRPHEGEVRVCSQP